MNGYRHWLAAATILASFPAAAFKFEIAEGFTGALDSSISFGMQMRMQDRSCELISRDNGGCASLGAELAEASGDVYALNTDDGNLNYDRHDIVSAVLKGTHELQLRTPWGLSFFGRISELYDWRAGETQRTPLEPEGESVSVRDVQPLDWYLSYNFEAWDRDMRLRVGSQVLSWGEDVFILAGINSINAYDVRRYHVAGTQVKEILRPAPMISFNGELLDTLAMEAYWQWRWDGFRLDPAGTYFSGADIVGPGNTGALYIPTSAINAGVAANPLGRAALAAGLIRPAPVGTVGDPAGTGLAPGQLAAGQSPAACLSAPGAIQQRLIEGFSVPGNPLSAVTATALVCSLLNTGTAIPLVSDADGSDGGQFGLSFRYRPEWADASFGFYYERYNSKIPFVSYMVDPVLAASNPVAAGYRIEYPRGIDLFGISYNTNLADWALGGEISWRPNEPLAIDTSVPTLAGQQPKYACVYGGGEAEGRHCRGWVKRSKLQAQHSFLQVFSPSSGLGGFVLPTLGAAEGVFIGEIGASYYPGLDPGDGTPWSLPAYALPDRFSAGYTVAMAVTYPNLFGSGFDFQPQFDWTQGVAGNSPNALPWIEGAKSTTLTFNFNRRNRITSALAYSWFTGGGAMNLSRDRDLLSYSVTYNF